MLLGAAPAEKYLRLLFRMQTRPMICSPPRDLPTAGQRRHSPQRHTTAGTSAPTSTGTGNAVPKRASPTQTAYAHPQRGAHAQSALVAVVESSSATHEQREAHPSATSRGSKLRVGVNLAFTRCCHDHYCMACIAIQKCREQILYCVIVWATKGGMGCPNKRGVFANSGIDSYTKA